jgi:hypothetical protein
MASLAMTMATSAATLSCVHPFKRATIGVHDHRVEPNQVFELLVIYDLGNNPTCRLFIDMIFSLNRGDSERRKKPY